MMCIVSYCIKYQCLSINESTNAVTMLKVCTAMKTFNYTHDHYPMLHLFHWNTVHIKQPQTSKLYNCTNK